MDQAHNKVPLTGNIYIAPLTFSFLFKAVLVPLLNVTRSWTRNTKETYPPFNVYIDVEKRPWMQIMFETAFPMGFPHFNIDHLVVTERWNPPNQAPSSLPAQAVIMLKNQRDVLPLNSSKVRSLIFIEGVRGNFQDLPVWLPWCPTKSVIFNRWKTKKMEIFQHQCH